MVRVVTYESFFKTFDSSLEEVGNRSFITIPITISNRKRLQIDNRDTVIFYISDNKTNKNL